MQDTGFRQDGVSDDDGETDMLAPLTISEEQRAAVEALSQTMNGNPRERLMREARATTGDKA